MLKRILNNKSIRMSSIYMIANIINKAIAFITIPIFSRLLTTNEYGIVSTYSSYVLILQYIMGLSSEYTVRNAYVDFKEKIPEYMASMYLLGITSSAIISSIILILNVVYFHMLTVPICICCLMQSFMTYINNAMSSKLMMDNNYIKRSVITAMPNIVSVILGIILILNIRNKVLGRILGYAVAVSLFGIYNIIYVFAKTEKKISTKYWGYILKISPPMILHGLSIISLSQLDRIMITTLRSASETGIYSIIYSMSMLVLAITQAIDGVWVPWFTKQYSDCRYIAINKRASQYLFAMSMIVPVIMFVMPEILMIATPKDYWSGISMIPPLVLSSFFIYLYQYYVNLELYEKRTKTISVLTFTATVFNIVTNYIFIPKYGVFAAAYTTLFSYILLFLLHCLVGRHINKNVFELKSIFYSLLTVFVALFVFYIFIDKLLVRWSLAIFALIILVLKSYHLYEENGGKV